ncbi:MAG: Asp-tRNA(Asn)/Glu-tRNA(Gln) amidotransferase subunit GatA [Magnetococcales bacterium]|nr:Asp-tRNA(Asn)/Glu-tRNA(Gln) amidotransferase subunit GatA [Magnetococcales bacterium]
MNPVHLSLTEAARLLADRSLSATELTRACLEAIRQQDATLNAFITVAEPQALAAAEQADQQLAKGDAPPLTGLPLAIKDIFCTTDMPTTCGSRMLKGFLSPYESTVTRRLRQAGAVLLGKTNMDEFAMGSSTETSHFGPTRNPWDPERTPGGSSGGSAVAVAAGLALGATGTDTGGSIRQPAALNGITGLKPTYGRVSRYGMVAFASSLDQAGPMTRSVEDAALLLQTMAGHDPLDATSIPEDPPRYADSLERSVKGLKIGLPKEYFPAELTDAIRNPLHEAQELFRRLGAELVPVSLPHTSYAIQTYYILAPAEASSNLARYDGVKFGYRCQQPRDLADLYCRSRAEGFGAEVKRRIMLGTYVLSSGYYDAFYRKAQKVRRLIADDFAAAFREVDVLLTPTAPDVAFRLGEKTDDPVAMYLSDIFTINVNLAGLPALSLPCGLHEGRLPVGMQLIGPPLGEEVLFQTGHAFQRNSDWHRRRPQPVANGAAS